ncbi:hypothetical protein F5X99DRAFT_116261 [Biscogniauxia marginata]|nr:hypothetical protein F5X99DRAFT_116261 [Biscogniauxia marginata]
MVTPNKKFRFIDDTPLQGPPKTTRRALENPRLRRFPGSVNDITWIEYIGHGEEGHVYLADITDYGRVAVKVFWDTYQCPHYTFPVKSESRTVDLLQKLQAALSEAEKSPTQTIMVKHGAENRHVAQSNIRAFSDEERESSGNPYDESKQPVPSPPPFPSCHGWLEIQNTQLPNVYPQRHRVPDPSGHSIAIVYEYVEETQLDDAGKPIIDYTVTQSFFDYLRAVGLGLSFTGRNWRQSRLVDFNDIRTPPNPRWSNMSLGPYYASKVQWIDYSVDPR